MLGTLSLSHQPGATQNRYEVDVHRPLTCALVWPKSGNDSHGVVLAELTAEKDGRVLTARVVQVWHLTDGKATEYWSTLDPAGALNALRD